MISKRLTGIGVSAALACGACAPVEAAPEPEISAVAIDAAYYQPRLSDLHDAASRVVPDGVFVMPAEPGQPDSWTVGSCQPYNAANFLNSHASVSKLTSFSLGRIGVSYFLSDTTVEQQSAISSIVIVAPGNIEDFTDSCDPADTGKLIANWLTSDPHNRLMIVADQRTVEANFAGIDRLYLKDIGRTATADQVLLCDGSSMSHEETWNTVKDDVFRDPRRCPVKTVRRAI